MVFRGIFTPYGSVFNHCGAAFRAEFTGQDLDDDSHLYYFQARFYDPQQGRVLVDGRDIRDFRFASYLQAIAIVSQDPFLFNTTIRENIRYGRETASDENREARIPPETLFSWHSGKSALTTRPSRAYISLILFQRLGTGVVGLKRGSESRVRWEPVLARRLNGPGSRQPRANPL